MSITRRLLLAIIGITLPVALTAAGAHAASGPVVHHHHRHHATHSVNARTHHHKALHHTAAALGHSRSQA